MSESENLHTQRLLVRAKTTSIINRNSTVDRIKHIVDQAIKLSNDPSLRDSFLTAAEDLVPSWDKFITENRAVLDALLDLDQLDEFSIDLERKTRDLYISAMTVVNQIRAAYPQKNGNEPCHEDKTFHRRQSTSYGSRLPEIPLPSFAGDLYEWPTFRDRFEALVGQRYDLSDVERFYYLLGCLKDDARLAIRNIHVSGHNYAFAWQTLIDRFDKPRQLAMVIVEKLLSVPMQSQESLTGLKEFLLLFSDNVHMLRSLNVPDLGEFLIFVLSLRCLPISTRHQFELKHTGGFSQLAELVDFIKTRIAAFEAAGTLNSSRHSPNRLEPSKGSNIKQSNFQHKSKAILVSTKPEPLDPSTCPFCTGPHVGSVCPQFTTLSVDERSKLAREKKVCFSCLSSIHWSNKCQARNSCKKCSRHHHSLLHPETPVPISDAPAALFGQSTQPTVLLGTALIHVQDAVGCMRPVQALIDSASQISVITSDCANRLGLRSRKWTVPLTGIAGVQVPNLEGVVDCYISPHYAPDDILHIKTWILPRVTGIMPTRQFPTSLKERFAHLALADPEFDCPASVDLLLGADVFSQIFDGKRVLVDDSLPAAYSSLFVWIIIGPVLDSNMTVHASHLVSLTVSLEDAVERFWRLEEPEPAPPNFTEEGKCEEIYLSERTRDESGRFVVPLSFRGPIEKEHFPGSRQVALRRFENLERKFKSDPNLQQTYTDFMREYLKLGYISIAAEPGVYFLPYHAVFKRSPIPKIRVIFDASCQVASGQSIISRLFTGPKLQQDLVDILLRFRVHKLVFTADLCQMYRQILVQPEYRRFQHIFWRESPLHELKEYQLNTVTYGMNCAPYLALRVLKDIAEHDCSDFPAVKNTILTQTYIDDVCVGADNLSDILQLQSNLKHVLNRAGFQLKKWISNVESVLLAVPPEDRLLDSLRFKSDNVNITKVLGIQWHATADVFSYDVHTLLPVMTKRGVLSVISRIFDPLGLLGPATFYAKHIMQLIWQAEVSWDEPLPTDLAEQW